MPQTSLFGALFAIVFYLHSGEILPEYLSFRIGFSSEIDDSREETFCFQSPILGAAVFGGIHVRGIDGQGSESWNSNCDWPIHGFHAETSKSLRGALARRDLSQFSAIDSGNVNINSGNNIVNYLDNAGPPPGPSSQGAVCLGQLYPVQSGDTLDQLASTCGINEEAFQTLNPQVSNVSAIYDGELLCMPYGCVGKIYIHGLASNITGGPATEPLPTLASSPTGPVSSPVLGNTCLGLLYTVQSGDSVAQLASQCSTNQSSILALNPQVKNSSQVVAGNQLCIPANCAGLVSGVSGGPVTEPLPTLASAPVAPASTGPSPASPPYSKDYCLGRMHTIQSSDFISKLASSCGTDEQTLLDINPSLTDSNNTLVGEEIWLCLPVTCSDLYGLGPWPAESPQAPELPQLPPVPAPAPSGLTCSGELYRLATYILLPGDSIAHLATACGIDEATILAVNPQITNYNQTAAGDELCLPTTCAGKLLTNVESPQPAPAPAPAPVPAPAPAPVPAPVPAPWIPLPKPPSPSGVADCAGKVYTIQTGDTIAQLASSCSTDQSTLLAANPQITDSNSILAGDKLCLPTMCSDPTDGIGPAGPSVILVTPVPAVTPSSSLNPSTSSTTSKSKNESISGGTIAGIAIGALAGLVLVAALALFLRQKLRKGKTHQLPVSDHQLASKDFKLGDSADSVPHYQEISGSTDTTASSVISAKPYSLVVRSSEVVHMEDICLSKAVASSESFADLPKKWHIPLSSVRLLCQGDGSPIILGKGGYGVVYKAIVRREEAAIKIVKGGGKDEQARLLHEITILEQCKSTHIVQFLGYSLGEDGLLLCMEYVAGGTLYASLGSSKEFQWYNRGWQAMRAIAAGLCCLHEHDVAHLDLKTPNILIGADKRVKIADLGLGKLVRGKETHATQLGTVAWMAPEVLLKGTCSLKSDVWSFSTIVWEVCTLRRPQYALTAEDIVVPDEAPQELVDLFRACRAENYWDRPAMADIYDWLDTIPHTL